MSRGGSNRLSNRSSKFKHCGENLNPITIGVVGSGLMGVGIATQAALHGYPTIVHDIDAARLASVHGKAEAILDEFP